MTTMKMKMKMTAVAALVFGVTGMAHASMAAPGDDAQLRIEGAVTLSACDVLLDGGSSKTLTMQTITKLAANNLVPSANGLIDPSVVTSAIAGNNTTVASLDHCENLPKGGVAYLVVDGAAAVDTGGGTNDAVPFMDGGSALGYGYGVVAENTAGPTNFNPDVKTLTHGNGAISTVPTNAPDNAYLIMDSKANAAATGSQLNSTRTTLTPVYLAAGAGGSALPGASSASLTLSFVSTDQ